MSNELNGTNARLQLPVLQKGDKGPYVFALQKRLGIRADGVFDEATEAAVRKFQYFAKLKVDGVVRDEVWRALAVISSQRPSVAPSAEVIDMPHITDEDGANTNWLPDPPPESEPLKWPTFAYFGRLLLLYAGIAATTGIVALFVITAIARPSLVISFAVGILVAVSFVRFREITAADAMHNISRTISGLLRHPA